MLSRSIRTLSIERHRRRIGNLRLHVPHLRHIAEDADALAGQQLLRHGPGRHAADGLTCTGTSTAAVVAEAELGVEGVVRMAGAVLVLDVAVVAAALVRVAEEQADGGAVGASLEDAAPDFGEVGFLPLGGEFRLPRHAPLQVGEEVVHAEFQPGGAAVDDAEVARPVADARGGDAEEFAEGIACHSADYTGPKGRDEN
jgi:hypothetical protein